MAFYWRLRRLKPAHRKHIANRLLELREILKKEVTNKKNVGELKIASWNLMHFGGSGGYKRSTESLQYIAEIIDHFDLVSVQEVKRDLTQLKTLLKDFLGDDWDYIVSDTTEGDAGNDERMAVLYRKDRVKFSRVAGEIVLPPDAKVSEGDHRQLARSPFYLGFQAGWFKFKVCSVHIHYGAKGGEDKKIRVSEIEKTGKVFDSTIQRRSGNARSNLQNRRSGTQPPAPPTMFCWEISTFTAPKTMNPKRHWWKMDLMCLMTLMICPPTPEKQESRSTKSQFVFKTPDFPRAAVACSTSER